MISDWRGKRVTVMGLGRFGGGVGVTRWLARHGARVLLTDTQPAEKLGKSLERINDLDVELHLGGHRESDFQNADLVVVNPAVPDTAPLLQVARQAGVPLTTEMNLFVERCPARTVGITGSVGKSTITAMIAHVLQKILTNTRVRLGGNIGHSLLDDLDDIQATDTVVLELSSFQLQRIPIVRWSPHVAVITNVTPNHLDWHGDYDTYLSAKLNIVRYQDPVRDSIVVENVPDLRRQLESLRERAGLWSYGLDGDDLIALSHPRAASAESETDLRWRDVKLNVPGQHNRHNAAAALTVAHLLGVDMSAAIAAVADFQALPDRLQFVAERAGVKYYNDSKSTTPEAAITAMHALSSPLLLILGGYDKGSDMHALADEVARRARFCACIGQTGGQLADLVNAAGGSAELCGDLATAVAACRARAQTGDSILLSPACASWDQFDDYRVRGAEFTRLAQSTD
ncbi:MAG: UDP-N-acetylmuramoyl-L-alanine--D-glutamate ligase [Planctomycetota bacterium]